MKLMKRLFLSSTAALVMANGALAADLPVKAKPAQYVKVCEMYGAGVYYIPGSDTCIRIGGYIRADYYWNAGSGGVSNYTGAGGRQNRSDTNDFATRHRAHVFMESRTPTQYGVLRTVTGLHFQNQSQNETFT